MATLGDLLVAIGIQTDDLTSGAEGAANDVEGSLNGIAAAAAGAAAGAAFAAGLTSAMDASAASTRLANQLDLTAAEAQRAGGVAGDVFRTGFGGSIVEVNDALGGVVANIGGMGDASDKELQAMTKAALGLADTFEFDVAESTQAVGSLIKSGLAKDGQEAFDLLTGAAQKLPPAMREELPTLTNEYSEFFDQLGFKGPQMMGLLAQASENPLFELDKLGDAVKEFTLLLADTDAVREPLNQLGLDVEHIQGLVNAGKGTQAFDEVTGALRDVEDQSERTRLQAAPFGGPGEDMGNSLLELDAAGAAAASGMDKASGAANDITSDMQSSPAQQLDSIFRTLSGTIGETLAPALAKISTFMKENPGLIQALTPVILLLAVALGIAAVAQWAMNSAMLANPMTWIIVGIIALVAIIVMIATKTTWFQDAWKAMTAAIGTAWDWIWEKLKQGFQLLKDLFLNFTGPGLIIKHWDTIKEAFGSAISWITDKVSGGIDSVLGFFEDLSKIPGKVGRWFGDIGGTIAEPFKSGFNSVAGFWNSTVGGFSFSIPDWVPGIGGSSWSIPDIPRLAQGGIVPATPGGVLALVGEGGQDEAVMPLGKLDGMLRGVAGAVRGTGDGSGHRLTINLAGAPEWLKEAIRETVRTDGGGDVQLAFGD